MTRTIDKNHLPGRGQFNNMEDLLCLSTLIATELLSTKATFVDTAIYFEKLGTEGCNICPVKVKCLACLINE